MRTLGIDLGTTRVVAAAGGAVPPLGVLRAEVALGPEGEDVMARALGVLLETIGLDPPQVSAIAVLPAADDAPDRRRAIVAAAHRAGLGEVRGVSAPIAIALALGRSGGRAAVYDLGASRFAFSIVDCAARPFSVIAHRGDEQLGGREVDRALARFVAARLARESGHDLARDAAVWDRLMRACERAKLQLARDESTSIDVAHADPTAPTQVSTIALDRRLLLDRAGDVVRRTLAIADDVLAQSPAVDAVLLAGGSAALPGLAEELAARFGAPARALRDPAHAAAIGASLAAEHPDRAALWGPAAFD